MRVFMWHVHGSYTTALVQGQHEFLVPVLPGRGPDGLGRARTWDWPASVIEVSPEEAATEEVDVVVLQRPAELDHLAPHWLGGRRPGRDVPAVYLEHNAPQGRIADMRHPAANRRDLTVVHVTHFNDLFWDTGATPTRVIEHGIVDPGYRATGELDRGVAVINEPARRWRVTGTDLLGRLAAESGTPIDLFGMRSEPVGGRGLDQAELHTEMARRRVYVHPVRWTSLGLALIEAMHLGLPVVGLATTEVSEAVPPEAGVVSTNLATVADGLRRLIADPEEAVVRGKAARAAALSRYGLDRFLRDWDTVFEEAVG
jgi:Glycosyl transferases group 1